MNWGKWIIVSFILFAAFIGILVVVCVREDISLVSKDYYKEELAYQDQIIRIKNTSKLANPPTIKVINAGALQIDYDHFNEMEKGELKLFRPSDPALDRKFDIKQSAVSMQVVTMENLSKGMYRARLQWSMHGEEFYIEEVIFI